MYLRTVRELLAPGYCRMKPLGHPSKGVAPFLGWIRYNDML